MSVNVQKGRRKPERVVAESGDLRIVTIPRYCKQCGICVKFCPKDVLEIRDFKVYVARIEDCTRCMQCELRCPDFAIEVHGEETKESGE